MNATGPSTTPSRVSAVSPVRWMHAFSYTPDSTSIRNGPQHILAADNNVPKSNEDDLPTQFRPRHARSRAVNGALRPGCDNPLPGDDSKVSGPALMVPVKRMRQSGGREALPLASVAGGVSTTHKLSTQRRTGKTRSRTRDTSAVGGSNRNQGLSHSPASPTRLRSHRVVLDAVEIVSKKRPHGRMANSRTVCNGCPTESARKMPSSHYPSPPVSRAQDVAYDGNPRLIMEPENYANPGTTSLLKTSKYFASVSTLPTRSESECTPVLTPPSSPILTIPVSIESSDFDPLLDVSPDEPVEDPVDEPGYTSSWNGNPGLLADLMVMLRRLKPILVQESIQDDAWKVLVAVRLLNVTTGKAAIPVFCKIISRWPTPQDLVQAPQDELVELLRPLGLHNKRANWLKEVSEYFLEDRESRNCSKTSLVSLLSEESTVPAAPHLNFPGVGPYALDSLRIFCAGDKGAWKRVIPRDKELVRYLRWRWAVEEGKVWYPGGMGVIGDVDVPYLITLVDELAKHYDSTIGGEGYMYHFCNDLCDVLMEEQSIP